MGHDFPKRIHSVPVATHQLEQLGQGEGAGDAVVVLCKHVLELLQPEAAPGVACLAAWPRLYMLQKRLQPRFLDWTMIQSPLCRYPQ